MADNSKSSDWDKIESACNCVDTDRLWRMHEKMAEFGAIPGPGVNRQAFSADDISARIELLSWVEQYGFEVYIDGIANIFIRRPGRDSSLSPLVTGSHMDSQPSGGRFDGIFGVLSGLEILFALEDANLETLHPVEVVAWSNEEGSRFAPGAMGSMTYTGACDLGSLLEISDGNGLVLGDELRKTLQAMKNYLPRPFKSPIAGYIEAHIEQGPLLESESKTIGVVAGIQGTRWFNVNVFGESAHAGTTPVSVRKDALQAAITVICSINDLVSSEFDDLRYTIGRFDVLPNTPNSVAESVSFSIDIRHPEVGAVERIGNEIMKLCSSPTGGCSVSIQENFNRSPCKFSDLVVNTVENAVNRLQISNLKMTSGAFHDALFMNDICPTGMIFVPCEGGVSHNPKENAAPEDLAAGTRVLLASIVLLDTSL